MFSKLIAEKQQSAKYMVDEIFMFLQFFYSI